MRVRKRTSKPMTHYMNAHASVCDYVTTLDLEVTIAVARVRSRFACGDETNGWQKCEMAYTQVACPSHLRAVAPIIRDKNGSGRMSVSARGTAGAAGRPKAHVRVLERTSQPTARLRERSSKSGRCTAGCRRVSVRNVSPRS